MRKRRDIVGEEKMELARGSRKTCGALLTNFLQPHWEWVKTAFDVAKPCVVSRILSLTGVHGHVAEALLAEMQDVLGSACFENCETTFRCSRCIRQWRWRPQCCGAGWPNMCCGKPMKN